MDNAGLSSWTDPKSILVATNLTDIERLLPYAKLQAVAIGAMLWLFRQLAAPYAVLMVSH